MAAREPEAHELAEQSLALAEETGDKLAQSGALGTLGELAVAVGDHAKAATYFERGLELRRALGDKRLVANSLLALGRVEILLGALDRSAALLEEALTLARSVKDTWSISVALANLGRVELLRGEPALASALFEDGLRIARERNDRRTAADLVQGLAAADALQGKQADAARLAGAADMLRASTGAAVSPVEAMVDERFLAPVRASLGEGYQAQYTLGNRLDVTEAFAAGDERRSASTVASPAAS